MMAGVMQPCFNNNCSRITVETFEERLVREAKFAKDDVATFTTWDKIPLAVEHVAGATRTTVFANTKPGVFDADKTLFPMALSYLKANKPRFLYISLGDADDWGHANDYPMYLRTMREYDDDLVALFNTLSSMGDYGKRTTVIVTTDHGRGKGAAWKDHGGNPDGMAIWAYAAGPTVKPTGRITTGHHDHRDIRPTVEALFGLCPNSGPGTSAGFPEVVAPAYAASLCPPTTTAPTTAKAP
jgi:hypothetical protein